MPTWRSVLLDCGGVVVEARPEHVRAVDRETGRALESPRDIASLHVARSVRPAFVTLVMDASSSMASRSRQATDFVVELLRSLRRGDRIRLVVFESQVARTDFVEVGDFVRSVTLRELASCLGRGSRQDAEQSPSVARMLHEVREGGPREGRDARIAALDAAMARLAPEARDEVQEWALRRHLRRELRPRHATSVLPALENAIAGLTRRQADGLLPVYDADNALVIVGDCRLYEGELDWSAIATLRCLLVQSWIVSVEQGCAWSPPFPVMRASLASELPEDVAAKVSLLLRSTFDVEMDIVRQELTSSGAVGFELDPPVPDYCALRAPSDFLPPRHVLSAALEADGDSTDSDRERARAVMRTLAARSWAVREVLRSLSPPGSRRRSELSTLAR